MKVANPESIERLCRAAADSPRLRAHELFHEGPDDPVQRLFIALQPGTVVRPHRHDRPQVWESHVWITGRYDLLYFSGDGSLDERIALGSDAHRYLEIDATRWHSLVVHEDDSVSLEFKYGPLQAVRPENFAAWAPAEGDSEAPRWERWARGAAIGERFPSV